MLKIAKTGSLVLFAYARTSKAQEGVAKNEGGAGLLKDGHNLQQRNLLLFQNFGNSFKKPDASETKACREVDLVWARPSLGQSREVPRFSSFHQTVFQNSTHCDSLGTSQR